MVQLPLFSGKIRSAFLFDPQSPRQAFYNIWIEKNNGVYLVKKTSGIKKKIVLDRRCLKLCDTFSNAQKLYRKMIKTKTNKNLKRKRIYKILNETIYLN